MLNFNHFLVDLKSIELIEEGHSVRVGHAGGKTQVGVETLFLGFFHLIGRKFDDELDARVGGVVLEGFNQLGIGLLLIVGILAPEPLF